MQGFIATGRCESNPTRYWGAQRERNVSSVLIGRNRLRIRIDPLAQMLVVTDLQASFRRGHAIPAAIGVEDEDGQATVDERLRRDGFKPRQDAALGGDGECQLW
jgi:hypothetical protein